MCDGERSGFFRPWKFVEEELEPKEEEKTKIEHEDEEDNRSITSSSYNYSENDCTSRRSSSVNSEDTSNSLNHLNNFVHGKSDDELRCSTNYTSAFTTVEWSKIEHSRLHQSASYQCASFQPNWPIPSAHLNGAGEVLGVDYAWLAPSYQSMQEAVERLNRQDAVAKQMKKLRPKKFRCHFCNVAFSNNGQLKGHLRIHTGERPFKCDANDCGKTFTRNEELTRHKRIHTGLRPYTCSVCRKGFGRKDHLKKHTKTHDNRSVYQLAAAAAAVAAAPYAAVAAAFPFTHHSPVLPYMYPI